MDNDRLGTLFVTRLCWFLWINMVWILLLSLSEVVDVDKTRTIAIYVLLCEKVKESFLYSRENKVDHSLVLI